jgi:hypothetical protein
MTQPRLNNLNLMCIENYILENIDFNYIIHDFSTSKCRRTPMQCSTHHRGTGTIGFVWNVILWNIILGNRQRCGLVEL